MATEEAELWEQIQFILTDGATRELEGQELVDFVNSEFERNELKANMGIVSDGYVVTYGIYSRKLALLKNDLKVETIYGAVEGTEEDWEYEVREDGTLKIINYKKPKEGEIKIPNIINGLLVRELGNGIFEYSEITSVKIPDCIEIIGNSTFSNCENLNCKIEFPSSLKEIGDYGFYGCGKITGDLNVIVNQKIQMGKNVFGGCKGMTGDIQVLMSTLGEEVDVIDEGQFSGFSGVTGTLIIPSRITEIKKNAFYGCSGLEGLEFENEEGLESKLVTIGDYAFYNCNSLKNIITMPKDLTTIGNYAFSDCTKIAGLELNDKLTSIGEYAFNNTSGLKGTVTIPCGVTEISQYCFYQSGLEYLVCNVIADEILNICTFAFGGSSNLLSASFNADSINLSNVTVNLGVGAFYDCRKLQSVINDQLIRNVEMGGFQRTSLVDCKFSNVKTIGGWAFEGCTSLQFLPTSKSLNFIGDYAFGGCISIEQNVIAYLKSNNVNVVGNNAFSGCSNLFGEVVGDYTSTFGRQISFGANPFDGTRVTRACVIDFDGKMTIADSEYSGATSLKDKDGNDVTEITIPETIKSIGNSAFSGCTSLTKVVINAPLTMLGTGVFGGCTNLKEVTLPDTLTLFSYSLFSGCSSLNTLNFPSSLEKIDTYALSGTNVSTLDLTHVKYLANQFGSCLSGYKKVIWGDSLISIADGAFWGVTFDCNVQIPGSVTFIGTGAFQETRLTSVEFLCDLSTIPNALFNSSSVQEVTFTHNVTSIGNGSFQNCSKLISIVMPETVGWSSVTNIGDNAFNGCSLWKETIELGNCTWNKENSFFNCPVNINKK